MRKRYVIVAKTYCKRNKQIAVGINNYNKTNRFFAELAARVGLPEKQCIHAEVLSLLRSKERNVHKITVERYHNDGTMALAKPCPVCQEAIKLFGVKVVEYTSENGWIREVQ